MAKLKTVIFGAGGFAREVLPFVKLNKKLSVVRFVDMNPKVDKLEGVAVIDETEFWKKYKKLGVKAVVVAVGEPAIREKIFTAVKNAKLQLPVIIHPSAVLADDFDCGEGTIIYPLVAAQVHCRVGAGVLLNTSCTVGHDTIIEDFANINPGVNIAGNVRIRKFAYLGIGSTVVEKITIGENTTIGAGAVVIDDMPGHVISVGIPAKVIRNLKSQG
jgi:sugar O-acyltransferase (sialic acid O-acetyltransferase NeuD family)